MRLQKPAIQVQGDLQSCRKRPVSIRRDHRHRQDQQIGLKVDGSAKDSVLGLDEQPFIASMDLDDRSSGIIVPDEENAFLERLAIETFLEPIGSNVPVENNDLGGRMEGLHAQSASQRQGTTDPGTVLLCGTNTLNHHDLSDPIEVDWASRPAVLRESAGGKTGLEFLQSENTRMAAVAELGASVFLSPGGYDSHAMRDLTAGSGFVSKSGCETSYKAP